MIRWHFRDLREAAEKAKKELSSAATTQILTCHSLQLHSEGPKHFDMNLTRAKFDELTHDLS